eukprot:Selendium_serpulae@DN2202_c0_g1_i1.p1
MLSLPGKIPEDFKKHVPKSNLTSLIALSSCEKSKKAFPEKWKSTTTATTKNIRQQTCFAFFCSDCTHPGRWICHSELQQIALSVCGGPTPHFLHLPARELRLLSAVFRCVCPPSLLPSTSIFAGRVASISLCRSGPLPLDDQAAQAPSPPRLPPPSATRTRPLGHEAFGVGSTSVRRAHSRKSSAVRRAWSPSCSLYSRSVGSLVGYRALR